jgi:hypothetical protein
MSFAVFFFWIGGAIATGMFASVRRNRNGFGWFVLALLISPLLAIIFCAILPEKPTPVHNGPQPKGFWEDLIGTHQKRAQPSKWRINSNNFDN